MARGFVYLAAVVDWFSRKILRYTNNLTGTNYRADHAQRALTRLCSCRYFSRLEPQAAFQSQRNLPA